MSELPEGWVSSPIGKVTTDAQQCKPKDDFIYIDISSINRETKIIENPQTLTGANAPSRARKIVKTGDVLVSMTRPNLNAVALVPPELDNQIASTGLDVLRSTGIDPRWLFYLVRSNNFVSAMSDLVQGALYPAVRSKDIRDFEIPLAPLAEQKRIADKLDALLARVDGCRARLARVPAILKRFRQAVLAAATSGALTADWRETHGKNVSSVQKFLDQIEQQRSRFWDSKTENRRYSPPVMCDEQDLPEIPESWVWSTADALCGQITDGEHIQPPYQPHGYLMLTAKHVRDGYVIFEDAGYISKEDFIKCRKRCAPELNDILIVSVGATTGRAAIVESDEPFAIVRSVLLLKPLISSNYLLRWLQSPWCFNWMTKASGASAQAHLYIKDTKRIPVPIPPPEEQHEIVRRVETLFGYADRLEARYQAALTRVERLTPALLAKAFRGELVAQDSTDEPAAVLLARLQAARGAMGEPRAQRADPASIEIDACHSKLR